MKIVQKHFGEGGLLNKSQFGFRARHSRTLQCIMLMDHVTLNFSSNMSMAAVFLDIEKSFDATLHPGLLYELPKLQLAYLIKLISSFLSRYKFSVYSGKQNVFAKGNASKGASRFWPVPYYVQHVRK
jgi:hypothetical protein